MPGFPAISYILPERDITHETVTMNTRQEILLLARISRSRFVLAGFSLYTLGYLWALSAGYRFDPVLFAAGYAVAAFAHLSVHYSNEYFDRGSDTTGSPTPVSGGTGILVRYPALAGKALAVSVILAALSWAGSAALTLLLPYPSWFPVYVLAGNLMGWWYSAPPFRFSSSGLGEPATMLAIALFLPGCGYIAAAHGLDYRFLPLCLPLLFLGLFFILSAELPDMETDRQAGKANFVARHGRGRARRIILVSSLGAVGAFGIAAAGYLPARHLLLPVIPLSVIFPVLALRGFRAGSPDRDAVIREAAANITGLVLFVGVADALFLAGYLLR